MVDHLKTVETNTEPAFILTNDLGDGHATGSVLLLPYWCSGDENEVPLKPTMETDGVVYLEKEDIRKIIAALEEFL